MAVLAAALYAITALSPAPDPQAVRDAASDARVDETDLLGALLTVGEASPREYLYRTGELERPYTPALVSDGLPVGGALGRRLLCIERYESNHSATALNRSSGARGWLQWLPSTARQWGVIVGDRASEWNAAARIAALGERFFVSQWVPLQRGLC
jgi:hypothetical protein